MIDISFVIPLYNEESMIPTLLKRLNGVMDTINMDVEVVLVDDGSRDNTLNLIKSVAFSDPRYHVLALSRNYGHQLALSAGLSEARGTKGVMVIDGDLQDPPELLPDFFKKYLEGYDVVYAVRQKRKESKIKRLGYWLFYRLMRTIAYIDIPVDSGDCAFLSRKIVDILNEMPEEQRYIRGMRSWIGFKQAGIKYDRNERQSGKSKYSFKKLLQLGYMGIFNFSAFPIKLISYLGLASTVIGFLYLIEVLIKKIFIGNVPIGFTAIIALITLFCGVQLLSLGVIGQYVLRIFYQVKKRPLYIIKSSVKDKKERS